MSHALLHVRSSLLAKSYVLAPMRFSGMICLMLLMAAPLWGIAPTTFLGVAHTQGTGSVSLSLPSDVVVDTAGNTYIADTGNSQIVKVNPQGDASVYVISGLSTALSFPAGITADDAGTLYIADSGNNRIVTVSVSGSGSVVSTGSVTLSSPQGVAVDQSGNLFIADTGNNRIVEVTSGVAAVFGITGLGVALNTPSGLAVDMAGNLYIADSVNSRIVKVAAGGTAGAPLSITGLATALDAPRDVAVDGFGNMYVADTNNNRIVKVTPAGAGSPLSTGSVTLSLPKGVAVDFSGTVYIADTSDNRSVTVAASAVGFSHLQLGTSSGATQTLPFTVNVATTLGAVKAFTFGTENLDFTVGAGTTCTTGTTNTTCTVEIEFLPTAPGLRRGAVVLYDNASPQSPVVTVPLYGSGDAPIAALGPNRATVINTAGLATRNPFQVALDGAGNMYAANYTGSNVTKIAAGGGTASVMSLGTPAGTPTQNITGVALDGAGNLFIGDHQNSRILVVTPGGVVSVLGISGLATTLGFPTALAFDGAGNLYIADFSNGRIIKVTALAIAGSTSTGNGTVLGTGSYSFAGSTLTGAGVDSQGTVYIAARTENSSSIVKVTASGVASLLATTGFTLSNPQGAGVDAMGNVYVVDTGHNRILKITTTGVASVLNISGLTNPSVLGSFLFGVTVDPSANIYIPDWTNNRIVYVNVSGASLSFANTKQGSTSTDSPKTATVTNLGNQPLVFTTDPTYTADFAQASSNTNPCTSNTSLAAGTACDVMVDFIPQSVGSLSADITVTNNTLNVAASTQQLAVSGTGLTPGDTTAVAVGVSSATVDVGEAFTITAAVTDTAAGHTSTVPAGSVTFIDTVGSTSVSLNGGNAVTLSSGIAALTGVTLSVSGSHTITANYAGVSGSFLASSNSGSVYVRKVPTVALASSANPALASSAVTFTATVSAGSGTPSGSVEFYEGTTLLGSGTLASGTATYATSNLTVGTHSVTAEYGGDTQFSALASTAVSQVVSDFSIAVASGGSSSATVTAGAAATYSLTIGPSAGTTFPAAATLSATGAPTGSAVTITPSTLAAGDGATNVTVTIQVPTTAALHWPSVFGPGLAPVMAGLLLVPWGIRRRLGGRGLMACGLLLATMAAGALLGCGGSSGTTPAPQPRSYTITLTATSGTVTNSTALHLTVH